MNTGDTKPPGAPTLSETLDIVSQSHAGAIETLYQRGLLTDLGAAEDLLGVLVEPRPGIDLPAGWSWLDGAPYAWSRSYAWPFICGATRDDNVYVCAMLVEGGIDIATRDNTGTGQAVAEAYAPVIAKANDAIRAGLDSAQKGRRP